MIYLLANESPPHRVILYLNISIFSVLDVKVVNHWLLHYLL